MKRLLLYALRALKEFTKKIYATLQFDEIKWPLVLVMQPRPWLHWLKPRRQRSDPLKTWERTHGVIGFKPKVVVFSG